MSEIMRGVLFMPPSCWSNDDIDVAQRHGIYVQAGKKLDALELEIEQLRAVVDRLPKTADGVPVIVSEEPELWVYCRRTGLYRPNEGTGPWLFRVDGYEAGRFTGYVEGSHRQSFSCDEVFSTREAAEAARFPAYALLCPSV